MQLNVQLLHPAAQLPTYGTDGAACFDLYAIVDGEAVTVGPDRPVTLRTGLAFEIPQGWCLLDQELELGLMSVAAPVYHGPKVVAAVNVSLQAQSVAAKPDPEAFLESVRKEIVATAEKISTDFSTGR